MISEKITVGEGTEYPLNGLLTLPDDLSGPVPAVVMVHGSGPSDMDERVMKLTPFKDLAEGGNFRGIIMLAGTPYRLEDILKAAKEYGTERHIGEDVTGDIYEFISAV